MNCENPQRIYNKYLGHFVVVPCGKCDSCRITKSNSLTVRVSQECENHPYNIFFTLTYTNFYIPYLDNECNLCSLDGRFSDGLVFSSDLQKEKYTNTINMIKSDRPYYPITNFGDDGCLGVLIRSDIQNFIKRVRASVHYEFIDKKKLNKNGKYYTESEISVRYFVCGEMGTNFKRPHFHGIFHTDDVEVAEFVRQNICKSWQYCDWNQVKRLEQKDGRKRFPTYVAGGSASSYVSSYVNSVNLASNALENGFFKPFCLFSKRPLYGMSKVDKEILSDTIRDFNCKPFREIQRCLNGELSSSVHVLQSFVLRSLFPRYNGIDKESFEDKLRLCLYDSSDSQRHNFVSKARRFVKQYFGSVTSASLSLYLRLYDIVVSSLKSYLLKEFMCTYNSSRPIEYVKSCYHTMEDKLNGVNFFIRNTILSNFGVDLDKTPLSIYDFGSCYYSNICHRKLRYASKLLPKHYNSSLFKF